MNGFNGFLRNDYLGLVVRLAVGIIFVYASIDKIAQPGQFARIVYNYHLLPGELVNLMAIIMPWIELFCGAFLILGIYKEGSVLILNVLVLVFIVAVGVNLFRGVDLECGCFTVSSKAKGAVLGLLIRDIGLLILTIYLFFNRSRRFCLIKTRG
ncbi:MAG: DoxX family membrane protein [Candidatus Zixiibacteriota bacterium]|nr:MAG: DoxX family membrane protein [candidate division Zixibacteria bacterium]